eukprot:CAMPEP_0198153214 /NCGR_PEP_ID=MMETSP1443-20131203/63205_1 /TAXON_ID=186043 /ORGANISM="Entomoneis sp., Strain CCMP2396" /LENGTH=49 /DNA_ID= /DNA_START= /DNA_END= /DNA_ORIENTATION=
MAFEVDFFRADYLADKTNEEILQITLDAMSAALDCKTHFDPSSCLLDSS